MRRSFLSALATTCGIAYEMSTAELNSIFVDNHKSDREHRFKMSKESPFINYTWDEFKSTILMAPQECSATMTGRSSVLGEAEELPESFDWRDLGKVTPVKNQGQCGSCYSFSSTGALESHHVIKYGGDISLSEQQILDCGQDFDNHGCDGGLPSHVFEYVHHAGGIDTDQAYPYHAHAESCHFQPAGVGA